MSTEGVDYSTTPNADWAGLAAALKAAGKSHAGRYAVNDKSPAGRGITRAEFDALHAAGIAVFIYWEGSANWMLGGFAAGVAAAENAQTNLSGESLPTDAVVYFACDVDATEADQFAIDDCLRGCASVIGLNRVGIYGGYWVVSRCSINGTARWFAQTLAWSGGQWFSGNHLEQYGFNDIIAGVDCDDVRAMQANFGQVDFSPAPVPVPVPPPAPAPVIVYPAGLDKGLCERFFGTFKASNGVTVAYSEGDELSKLWLASGSYARLIDVGVYVDSPTITRLVYQFSDGRVYWRPNASEPFRALKSD